MLTALAIAAVSACSEGTNVDSSIAVGPQVPNSSLKSNALRPAFSEPNPTCPAGSIDGGSPTGQGGIVCVVGGSGSGNGGGQGTGGPGGATPSPVAKNTTCNGALAENTSTNGTNNHSSQISNSLAIWADVGGVNSIVAYEYQTYGGSEYIQFLTQISVSAGSGVAVGVGPTGITLFPFNGSVYNSLQNALNLAHAVQSALPFPWNDLAPSTSIQKNQCSSATATG